MSMSDKFDEAAGKLKKGAGKVSGDEDLEREGQAQEGVAKAKDAVKDAADKVKGAAKDAFDKFR